MIKVGDRVNVISKKGGPTLTGTVTHVLHGYYGVQLDYPKTRRAFPAEIVKLIKSNNSGEESWKDIWDENK